jgi:hypothetical protein
MLMKVWGITISGCDSKCYYATMYENRDVVLSRKFCIAEGA